MSDRNHPVDSALRRIAGHPEPTETDRRLSQARLDGAIAAEQAKLQHRARRGRRPVVGAAAALVILTGALVVIEAVSPTPTEAAMEDIARAAEMTDPLTIPDQQFAYTKTEETALAIIPAEALENVAFDKDHLVYLLPTVRETWIGSEGVVQIRTTSDAPEFFNQSDEQAYYEEGLDEADAIGEAATVTVTEAPDSVAWPSEADALDQAIQQAAAAGRGLPDTVEYLDVALDILAEPFITRELRANTLRLIGELPDLKVADSQTRGTTTFMIEYQDQGIDTRLTFMLSNEGELVAEEIIHLQDDQRFGIPANTAVFNAKYSVPLIVESLDAPSGARSHLPGGWSQHQNIWVS